LHACCANCAIHPVRSLRDRGVEPSLLWFNPNIHPLEEYHRRLQALWRLQERWALRVLYRAEYGLKDFLRAVGEDTQEGARCRACYRLRLLETARLAKALRMDAFGSTLLSSPYQKFDIILAAAQEAEALHRVPFYFEDFRGGYREALGVGKQMGLYRQRYCGCIFSERERFHGRSSGNR